ncbi:MAG: alpha-amylase family glycosyl hydrolase [Gemmatimonadaceae bacterium]
MASFWLGEMGADGFRLDAIPYLVEEGGRLSHTPGTHALLREYAAYVQQVAPDAFTIGEVWDSTGAMLPYYPDQLDAHFAFEASDAILAAVRSSSASRLFPAFLRLQRALPSHRYAPFLRNHDQMRTLTELGGEIARARLAATLLLTLPGVPFIYYGEEIGMTGNKPDERLRTPMHWNGGPGAGFTSGTVWEPLQPDWPTTNVEVQDSDSNSLLNLHRRLIHLRAENTALASGELVPLAASSDTVAAYLRLEAGSDRAVLVVVNLGGSALSGVTLSSQGRVLSPGLYNPKSLLGGESAASLQIGSDGRVNSYAPLLSLAPMESYLYELLRDSP